MVDTNRKGPIARLKLPVRAIRYASGGTNIAATQPAYHSHPMFLANRSSNPYQANEAAIAISSADAISEAAF